MLAANPRLEVAKQTMISNDVNNNGNADAGDTLLYRVVITNLSATTALNLRLQDTPDPKSRLVVGSIRTTQGVVTSGNTAGNTTIGVNVGSLVSAVPVVITYQVTILNNASGGVISNQAVVTSNDGVVRSDDPRTAQLNDATKVQMGVRPAAISLTYFRAQAHIRGVIIDWQTSHEDGSWRYRVYRELSNGRRTLVSACANIPAKGSMYQSATYRCIDTNRQATRYVLEEVTRMGVSTFYVTPKRLR